MLRLAGEGSPYGYSEYDGSPGGAAGPSGSQPMQPQQQLPYQQDQFPHLGELPGAPECSCWRAGMPLGVLRTLLGRAGANPATLSRLRSLLGAPGRPA